MKKLISLVSIVLSVLMAVTIIVSIPSVAFATESVFTDVKADDWFAEEVKYVYENGLMNGVGDSKFNPNGNVTRAMMWTTLARIAGEDTTGSDPWWLAGQQWAMKTGVSDGTMATDNITREQLVTMAYRYAQLKGYDVSVGEDTNILSYTDAFDVNEWAIAAMQWACGAGIINGIDGALQPQGYATRAQLAAILYRFVEEVVNDASGIHTVTFMWNYDNKGVCDTVEVEDGKSLIALRIPSRSDYDFSGWYTEDGERFTLNTKVTGDIVVYAKWTVHTHYWTAGTPVLPTCTSEGYTPYTCSCGSSRNGDIVPAVSHVAGEKCPHCGVTEVETAEQLAAALRANDEKIDVVLRNDIAVPVASLSQYGQTPGSGEYKLGGENTTAVTIDLNKHKLTLTTSYMTAIGAKNDNATITIKNGSMNGTGNSKTTWNIYDLIFANCNYVFEDVTFDKEVALCNTGKTVVMNDVTINGTGDYYALWIQAEGQTVNIDGLTVSTPGRGIKIDEQYSNEKVAKVTLTVSDAKFTTAKKAAILVKSAAGADITLSKIDISGVVADSFNAVWVDEDSASYYDLVAVTGGNKILEGTNFVVVKTADELVSAFANLKANDIIFIANDIDMTGKAIAPVKGNKGFTMRGNGNTISNLTSTESALFVAHSGSSSYTFDGVVLENCSVTSATKYAALFVGDGDTSDAITITNCHVKNCSVKSNKYAAAFVGYTAGWNVQNDGPVYSDITIENCSVTGGSITGGGSVGAAIGHAGGNPDTTNIITDFTVSGAAINGEDAEHTGIVVGTANVGKTIISNVTYTGVTGNYNNATNIYGRFVPNATGILIIDGAQVVTSTNSLSDVITSAAGEEVEVALAAGSYSLPSVSNGNVTISGTEDTVITINKPNMSGTDIAFEGVTIKGSGYSTGVQHVDTVTYTDVTIQGEMCLYGEKVVFNNCTFELNGQYIWTYGAKEVEFNKCTFNTTGKAILIYNEGAGASKVTVKGCTFNATASAKAGAIANQNCAAIEIDNFQKSGTGTAHTLITEGNIYGANFSGEWRIKNFVAGNAITVNGVEYTTIAIDGKTMTIDGSKNVTVNG